MFEEEGDVFTPSLAKALMRLKSFAWPGCGHRRYPTLRGVTGVEEIKF
jgi:hypothetical protein